MKPALLSMIRYYRRKGGGWFWFGADCNFEPSCSLYSYQAIEKYGAWKGVVLSVRRIRSCNQPDVVCKCIDPLE